MNIQAGRRSNPLTVHIVPRLPRKRGGDQGTPEGRQGVHPTPWQCTLPHACHAKEAWTKGHRRDARAYIRPLGSARCPTPATQKRRRPRDTGGTPGRTSDPLAVHIVPRLPRKRGGDQGTPEGRRTSDPLAVHSVPRLPRKRGGDQGTPEGRQGVHPTPWQCTLSHACHAKEAETKGHRRDARAYIRPLGSARCPTPATQKRRRPRDEGRQGVHPTPWQCTLSHACHAKAAETKGHRRDARAYIRPLGSARCPTPATQKRRRPRDTGGTPGRTSDPLAVHAVPHLPRKRGGDQGTPEGRQGVHPTPWQCTLCHACHAKAAETKGHRRDARAYIRPLGSAHCATPATQKRRRPRDTGGTPGRTSDPLAVHVVPRLPRKSGGDQGTPEGRQGVHPTPWQCTLYHACHAKAAMCEWVSEWVSEWVWVGVCVCVSECVCVWVSEWVSEWEWVSVSVCVCEWVSECEWEWVSVSECEWVCVSECVWVSVCVSESEWVWVSVSEWGGAAGGGAAGGGGADTELKTKTPHVKKKKDWCGTLVFFGWAQLDS